MNKRQALMAAAIAVSGSGLAATFAEGATPVVNSAGKLRVPVNYQESYQYLGTWSIAADAGKGAKEMHSVYASPGAVAQYKKTGHFTDGTVLVKEVFATQTLPMTTGTVSHPNTLKGWFVMVRDSKNTHKNNALWGDGWGWSWFNAGDPVHTTSTNYKNDCQGCHVPAKASDWIYVNGYRALQR
jgi:hypothetical protein